MKKLNFLTVLLCVCPMMMFGQLEVKPDGKTVAGSVTGWENAQLTVRLMDLSTTNADIIGLQSDVYGASPNSNQTVIGVEGLASAGGQYGCPGTVIGVKGSVGYNPGNNGRNYGVFGFFNAGGASGAAIYGSVQPYGGSVYVPVTGDYAGYFRGQVAITDRLNTPVISWSSDYRYKQNITELNAERKAINNLLNLNPVEYNFKQRYIAATDSLGKAVQVGYFDEKSQLFQKKHYGLIAQEVQKLYPDLVYEDGDGYLSIDYIGIIPLLIQTLKEQNARIEQLEKADNAVAFKAKAAGQGEQAAALYQNTPNPFTQSTEIKYYLPVSVSAAALCIYDLNGKQLKQIRLTERGDGSQIISGSEFAAGMYLYALIADGKEVDVKRMILTE